MAQNYDILTDDFKPAIKLFRELPESIHRQVIGAGLAGAARGAAKHLRRSAPKVSGYLRRHIRVRRVGGKINTIEGLRRIPGTSARLSVVAPHAGLVDNKGKSAGYVNRSLEASRGAQVAGFRLGSSKAFAKFETQLKTGTLSKSQQRIASFETV